MKRAEGGAGGGRGQGWTLRVGAEDRGSALGLASWSPQLVAGTGVGSSGPFALGGDGWCAFDAGGGEPREVRGAGLGLPNCQPGRACS